MLPLLLAAALATDPEPEPTPPLPVNASWDVLKPPRLGDAGLRATMAEAGEKLGDWTVQIAGIDVDGDYLLWLSREAPGEPFVRVVRERFGRAIDVPDLLRLVDDILAAEHRRGEKLFVTAGRARSWGVLVHPSEAFDGQRRDYPRRPTLPVDEPIPQEKLPPAADGDPLGPSWTTRFENPADEATAMKALADKRPAYADRVRSLVDQLRDQGAEVYVTSTVRYRERGYLMWGAFELSRATKEASVDEWVTELDAINRDWGLDVDITWRHPDGWEATIEAARAMKDTYDVVYATRGGARSSNHYDGVAVDFIALALPREVTLEAPDGAKRTFDLSGADESRDLSLTPELVRWIERHFDMHKLVGDYPHWDDAE